MHRIHCWSACLCGSCCSRGQLLHCPQPTCYPRILHLFVWANESAYSIWDIQVNENKEMESWVKKQQKNKITLITISCWDRNWWHACSLGFSEYLTWTPRTDHSLSCYYCATLWSAAELSPIPSSVARAEAAGPFAAETSFLPGEEG